MKHCFFILIAVILLTPVFCSAQSDPLPAAIAAQIDTTQAPSQLEKYDTTAIVPVPNQPGPAAQGPKQQSGQPDKKSVEFLTDGKEHTDELPAGTVAVYIDIEEAFNKNPWTIQARKNIKLELETKQIEFAQIKEQLSELKTKEDNLYDELGYYKPFYQALDFIEADSANLYPRLIKDDLKETLNTITFYSCDTRVESPLNTPAKTEEIRTQLKDLRKDILQKEAFMLNYKEVSKEEILSRQDVIIQAVLKEIYSGIKEYAALRNIGIVVDKQEIIYGKPLNITPEFVKWMKSYHKKYKEQYGDIL